MKVKVKLLTPTAKLPTKAHTTDACFDIYADCKTEDSNTRNYIIEPGNWCNIHTGISTEIPVGYFAAVYGRSGMGIKQHLRPSNCVGIIDADYYNNPDNEGHIYFQMINLSPFDIQLHKGDVIGQGIIKPYLVTEDDNASGDRLGGFGSTSK